MAAVIAVRPTRQEKEIARGIARHTDVPIEGVSTALRWGADECLLIAVANIGWLLTRIRRAGARAHHPSAGTFTVERDPPHPTSRGLRSKNIERTRG
jgi:hypothetical protein